MIELSFSRLPKIGVVYADEVDPNCFAFFPGFMAEIDSTIAVLNAIETAHRDDLAANPWLVERTDVSIAAYKAYRPRDVWRVGSYVMFATTLEGVVEKRYAWLMDMLGAHDPTWRTRHEALHAEAHVTRKKEMKPLRAVRNKVYAHTAWAQPQKSDPPEVQAASMWYFAGEGGGITADGLQFGGYHLGTDGVHSHMLPAMSMKWLLDHYPVHLAGWHEMLVEASERVCEIPDATLKSWMPAVHTVVGRRDRPATNAAEAAPASYGAAMCTGESRR